MAQVLYRKYRPKTFAEIEGQEHIVRTLQGALLSGRVGHAYLFCGPRGTGKTTMARLLAKALNCVKREDGDNIEPCNACPFCCEINEGRSLDLIEIDAASNRGIDEIRNLKDSAIVAAPSGKYKIFIIDEVHMLTPPAFNALLKILEEPPAHVVFVLATTEPHKVIDTILSRVQRFDFKKISADKIVGKLKRIVRTEKISVEEPALLALAVAASGSLRDAESALGKLIAYTGSARFGEAGSAKITAEDAAEILGVVPLQVHENLIDLIAQKKPQEAIAQISALFESGVELEYFNRQFIHHLRALLIAKIGYLPAVPAMQARPSFASQNLGGQASLAGLPAQAGITPEFLIRTINLFVKAGAELKFSPIPQLPLELAILELTKTP
jgi:DNA polymerase-3 subunit gamma/tau